jgi:hypothetical protein
VQPVGTNLDRACVILIARFRARGTAGQQFRWVERAGYPTVVSGGRRFHLPGLGFRVVGVGAGVSGVLPVAESADVVVVAGAAGGGTGMAPPGGAGGAMVGVVVSVVAG